MNELSFSKEELEAAAAAAAEMRREVDEWVAWLRSPEGRRWTDQQIQEATAIAEGFKKDCDAGKYALTAEELEALRRDGVLRNCHTRKSGGKPYD